MLHGLRCRKLIVFWKFNCKAPKKKLLIGPQPLPIMNIVFGELVGSFSDYFLPDSTTTESEFKASVSRLR